MNETTKKALRVGIVGGGPWGAALALAARRPRWSDTRR